jgi:hypothetical protein
MTSNKSERLMHLVGLIYFNGTECSETSAYKIRTPGNYPEENIQQTKHSESLKSRTCLQFGELFVDRVY